MQAKAWAEAVSSYAGPLLDGFLLEQVPEFESWLELERASLASAWRRAALHLCDELEASGRVAALELLATLRERLSLGGEHEWWSREGVRAWADELPDVCMMELERAAHHVWNDCPDAVFPAIEALLQGERRSTSARVVPMRASVPSSPCCHVSDVYPVP